MISNTILLHCRCNVSATADTQLNCHVDFDPIICFNELHQTVDFSATSRYSRISYETICEARRNQYRRDCRLLDADGRAVLVMMMISLGGVNGPMIPNIRLVAHL